jgi:hypothetical protein
VHVAVTARKWDLSPARLGVATLRRRVRDLHHNIKSRAFSFCHPPTFLIHKVSIFNKMSVPTTASTTTSSIPCPITALAPELREMIFDYYLAGMRSRKRKRQSDTIRIGHFRNLQPYFSMLHFSSLVRSEIAYEAYEAAFSGTWFKFKVDGNVNDVERMQEMFTSIQDANKDIEFGLQLTVSNHGRGELRRFINSFFDRSMTKGTLKHSFIHCKDFKEASQLQESHYNSNRMGLTIEYTHESRNRVCREFRRSGEYHELWMFGKLAKLDWSRFDFEFKAIPQKRLHSQKKVHPKAKLEHKNKTRDERNKWHNAEDGIDVDFDTDNEVVALDSDDDKIKGIFENSDVEEHLLDT